MPQERDVRAMEQGLQKMRRESNLAIWAERVEACRSSGLTIRRWCEENGVAPNTYYRWQKKVYDAVFPDQGQFYEVPVSKPSAGIAMTIEIGGITVNVRHGADEATILAALRAIKSC